MTHACRTRQNPGQGILVFGEVLFDYFADQARLGGAPFNVACHLRGLAGGRVVLVSRVGRDAPGLEIEREMRARGLGLEGLQHDARHPTGMVRVLEDPSGPAYEIPPGQAWDYIHGDHARVVGLAHQPAWVYFGTLAQRGVARQALLSLMQTTQAAGFLDVNLRGQWWSKEVLRWSFGRADTVKMNAFELHAIAEALGLGKCDAVEQGQRLMRRYGPRRLIVTEGERGAWMLDAEAGFARCPAAPARVVNTVGAGDAFAAVCLLGQLQGWSMETTLTRASALAADVCGLPGAVPDDDDFHAHYRRDWAPCKAVA
ncbi:MAG: PfkB family carbohydrate kinase [Pseudomonadota bacterium]